MAEERRAKKGGQPNDSVSPLKRLLDETGAGIPGAQRKGPDAEEATRGKGFGKGRAVSARPEPARAGSGAFTARKDSPPVASLPRDALTPIGAKEDGMWKWEAAMQVNNGSAKSLGPEGNPVVSAPGELVRDPRPPPLP